VKKLKSSYGIQSSHSRYMLENVVDSMCRVCNFKDVQCFNVGN